MADLSITAASVSLISGPSCDAYAGEALTAGQSAYLAADGKWYKAQRDGTQIEGGQYGLGIAVNSAPGVGQAVRIALPGALVAIGATVAANAIYRVSATAGAIADAAGSSTNYDSLLAFGVSTSRVRVIGAPAEAVTA